MSSSRERVVVLGAGVTGLAAASACGGVVYEATSRIGGLCSTYYASPASQPPRSSDECYRFEVGGGHWIFGGERAIVDFIDRTCGVKTYDRRAGVFFSASGLYVPYPIQHFLEYLPAQIADRVRTEVRADKHAPVTMSEWITARFGTTLTELFFGPFHKLYTAGLWTELAPQDEYKSPTNTSAGDQAAKKSGTKAGYNSVFIYPLNGLDSLARALGQNTVVNYGKRAVRVDPGRREVTFADGSIVQYEKLISTVPLNQFVSMCGFQIEHTPDPYTSVVVLNLGAVRGAACPNDHWLYIPDSKSGFYRVGFYSNVDRCFLPSKYRDANDHVSLYVECAYRGGQRPTRAEIAVYTSSVIRELQAWKFIGEVELADSTWIDTAYTWSWPGSQWRNIALDRIEEAGIVAVGRYGRWIFQGIADSIRDGFNAGSSVNG